MYMPSSNTRLKNKKTREKKKNKKKARRKRTQTLNRNNDQKNSEATSAAQAFYYAYGITDEIKEPPRPKPLTDLTCYFHNLEAVAEDSETLESCPEGFIDIALLSTQNKEAIETNMVAIEALLNTSAEQASLCKVAQRGEKNWEINLRAALVIHHYNLSEWFRTQSEDLALTNPIIYLNEQSN